MIRFASISSVLTMLFVFVAVISSPASATEVKRVSVNGIEAWLVEARANPLISVQFAFRGSGAALDPDGKEGLATMVAGLLDEGAGDLDSQAFQKELSDRSIRLRFNAGLDTFGGQVSTLTANRDRAFELLKLALTQPRFDAEPVKRIRGQLKASLRRQEQDPDHRANKRLFEELFPDHPYARPVNGSAESLARIKDHDLRSFVRGRLSTDRLVIGVVGDIGPEDLSDLLQSTFGTLPEQSASGEVASIIPATDGETIVELTNSPQSAIVFAQRGLFRDHPDFYAFIVLNEMVGAGGLTSRLYRAVRDERGLAYSVYARPVPFDHSALYVGGAGTVNDRAHETVDVIRDQWRQVAEDGFTQAELDDAKKHLTGSFLLRFTSNSRIAGMLVAMQMDNLGIDYIDQRNTFIEAVTLDDVNRLARTLIDPDALTFIIAGQPVALATE